MTTLLDPQKYSAQEIAHLYARRWKIELWFRDIKTSMGMEVLRCKSPKMLHKELEMFFIAYNLIRCLMVQAGAINNVALERMSFKGTVDSRAPIQPGHRPGPLKKEAAINSSSNYWRSSLATKCLTARTAGNLAPSNADPRPFPCSINLAVSSRKSAHRNRYWKSNPRKSSA